MNANAIDPTKVLFLDIETAPVTYKWGELDTDTQELWAQKMRFKMESRGVSAEEIYEEAGIYAEFGKVICICVGIVHGSPGDYQYKGKSFASTNEVDVLDSFTQLCDEHFSADEYFLCGHNGKEFDFPYIARRCIVNGMPVPRALDIGGLKPWQVKHLDTLQLWKFGDYKHYTSLNLLAHTLNIPTPKDDITGADVARVFWEENDLDRIVSYCHKDVVATAQVYLRMNNLALIKEEAITIQ